MYPHERQKKLRPLTKSVDWVINQLTLRFSAIVSLPPLWTWYWHLAAFALPVYSTSPSVCLAGPGLSLWDQGNAKGNTRVVIHRHKDVFHFLLRSGQQQRHFCWGRTDSRGHLLHIVTSDIVTILHQMWQPDTSAAPHLSSRFWGLIFQTSYCSPHVVHYSLPHGKTNGPKAM